jgi:hypothetical protein
MILALLYLAHSAPRFPLCSANVSPTDGKVGIDFARPTLPRLLFDSLLLLPVRPSDKRVVSIRSCRGLDFSSFLKTST